MTDATEKSKGERSPSYPFISLRKAEERARQFWEKHRKEAARLASVASTWGYGAKSSGLQQTVGALKQYGLLEDFGSGDERKVQLTELGRRLVADERPGSREGARRDAAMRPRLFQEYARWINEMPSDGHCLSELELDRGFNAAAAATFLKAFRETVSFAGLQNDDTLSSTLDRIDTEEDEPMEAPAPQRRNATNDMGMALAAPPPASSAQAPLSERLKVQMTVGSLSVSAVLQGADEIDTLIAYLQAGKVLFGKPN
jgi:hypothetical protein